MSWPTVKIHVFVTPKKTVLDPQGEAVGHALHSLGWSDLRQVRVGKFIELEVDAGEEKNLDDRIDQYCRDLLSNPVIEDYRWEIASR
ncbi:MAG: phosphoribosylformylglycinamidine synthase subunit PurS [Puniceicoccaceae bacterium]|nr:MAG: phosphoribosylformylglycinamidine synthase subunit PurS [Puniceicoccaceae bacterium]